MGMNDIIFVPSEDDSDTKNLKHEISFDVNTKRKGISISRLLNLSQQGHFQNGSIHEILEKCEMHLCSTPLAPRNPELEERISKLKAEQANKEYRSMTKCFSPQNSTRISFGEEIKSVSSQIAAVINFAFTVGGSFCFAYKAVEYALPTQNIPAQVMMGILTSTVVALADLYFLIRTI